MQIENSTGTYERAHSADPALFISNINWHLRQTETANSPTTSLEEGIWTELALPREAANLRPGMSTSALQDGRGRQREPDRGRRTSHQRIAPPGTPDTTFERRS